MSKIKIMDESLSNKIAAGEVVEKIANVVKELVENSIDAGSKNIKIELIDSGLKEIKITDDGSGMDEIDASNAFIRHATSKIYKIDDLFFLNTLGFRGEALPSIASISKIEMKTGLGDIGTKINIEGGKLISKEKCEARKGTIIKVNDIFYNTPARLKYLKSEQTELSYVTYYLERLALSYPSISFYLSNNGKKIIDTTSSTELLKTIHELYGLDVSKNMLNINASNDDYDIFGYISKPTILKSNRNHIITIVNNRTVKNNELNKTINDAYNTYKPDDKYPIVIIKINTDPTLIDVNIHPTKQDIKFSKMDSLKELILNTIKKTLYNELLIPEIEIRTKDTNNEIIIPKEYYIDNKQTKIEDDKLIKENEIIQETIDFISPIKNEKIKALELYPCGLVMGTYIIAQNETAMYLIDQHAAAERINYEKIVNALNNEKINTIELLLPISIELSPTDFIRFNEHIEYMTQMGFEIENFGINTIIIKKHPTWLIQNHEEENIRRIVEFIMLMPNEFDRLKFVDSIAKTCACKMSVKGNTNTTILEQEQLLNELVTCDNPYNCPHGRPTIITFTKYELEKMFKRVMD